MSWGLKMALTQETFLDGTLNADESAAKEEAKRHMQDSQLAYSNAEVVVKLQGWDDAHSKVVAQAALSALKQLILSDKNLPGTIFAISDSYRNVFLHVKDIVGSV